MVTNFVPYQASAYTFRKARQGSSGHCSRCGRPAVWMATLPKLPDGAAPRRKYRLALCDEHKRGYLWSKIKPGQRKILAKLVESPSATIDDLTHVIRLSAARVIPLLHKLHEKGHLDRDFRPLSDTPAPHDLLVRLKAASA
jgi:hypothetical protein